jgi:hypothetical protein
MAKTRPITTVGGASGSRNGAKAAARQPQLRPTTSSGKASSPSKSMCQPPRTRGLQPSTPRTRSRPRATATTLPQRRPASRHALINIMSPEKQMDNNFQLMHDQQTYSSHSVIVLDKSLELNGDANGDADNTSNSYDTDDIVPKQAPVNTHGTTSDSREP